MKNTILTLLVVAIPIFSAVGCSPESESAFASESTGDTPNEPEAPVAVEPQDNDWQFDTPKNHNIDNEILAALHETSGETGIYSIATAKDRYVIDEYYNKEYNEDSVFRFASRTESVSGALIGVAIEQVLTCGEWKGRQILPEIWVEESAKVQYERPGGSGSYGYQWRLRTLGAGNYDTCYAMGHGGRYIFVIPELKLVTAITGCLQDAYAPWPYFADYVPAACEQVAQ